MHHSCILSPSLFNFFAEYIMETNILEESQAGNKISSTNMNTLSYKNDTTQMAERH